MGSREKTGENKHPNSSGLYNKTKSALQQSLEAQPQNNTSHHPERTIFSAGSNYCTYYCYYYYYCSVNMLHKLSLFAFCCVWL